MSPKKRMPSNLSGLLPNESREARDESTTRFKLPPSLITWMKELLLIFKFSNCQTATLSNHLVEKELIGINLSMMDNFILWLAGSSLSLPQARELYPNMSQISYCTNTKNPQISQKNANKSPNIIKLPKRSPQHYATGYQRGLCWRCL